MRSKKDIVPKKNTPCTAICIEGQIREAFVWRRS